ncbi:branched-chain amino acid ABC transporter permease [Bradyrhizobium iriomotense]|uniref:branched-chain amino acid ABC transporter permease n=1 Tax=Bradyrhizobium iriomotense TaxID=441950 RepID=UPI001B8A3F1F|nr:branched-chain amino acid ABC transporter permease [Bradyrhizobium iriomotense]MBR0784777.1 branched-chain amino acid ABC transporter permease [Bradyrhizobium iriomotense]
MRILRSFGLALCILAAGGVLSLVLPEYHLRLLNLSVVASIAVIGLNIAFGYVGLISLGHAAFVGLGAYIMAISTTRLGLSPWLAMPAAVAATAAFAVAIGLPLLRLKGHYLALATLGLNVSFVIVASNWLEMTGGTNGIAQIPSFSILHHAISDERSFLWLALVSLTLVVVVATLLHHSRYGRALISVRDDELAAEMTGIDTTRLKIMGFAFSAAYAAFAGCLFASHVRFISPEDFSYAHSINYLAMLIVGGEGTIVGAILGSVLLTFLPEWLRFLGNAYLALFGLLVFLVLVFLPTGIVGLRKFVRGPSRVDRSVQAAAEVRP